VSFPLLPYSARSLRLPPFLLRRVRSASFCFEFPLAPRARVFRACTLLSRCHVAAVCLRAVVCWPPVSFCVCTSHPFHIVAFTCAARRVYLCRPFAVARSLLRGLSARWSVCARRFLYCLFAFLCAHTSFCVPASLSCRCFALRVAYLCAPASLVYSYVCCSVHVTVTRLFVPVSFVPFKLCCPSAWLRVFFVPTLRFVPLSCRCFALRVACLCALASLFCTCVCWSVHVAVTRLFVLVSFVPSKSYCPSTC
jgi:hypothetical protein